MPRMDPPRKKSIPPIHHRRDRQEPVVYFLRKLLFPTSKPSDPSITEDLLEALSPIWDKTIAPTLLSEFGNVATLYAIFYAPNPSENEVIWEVWDPAYFDKKPSAVFSLKVKPDFVGRLPRERSKAEVLTLENWY